MKELKIILATLVLIIAMILGTMVYMTKITMDDVVELDGSFYGQSTKR